MIPIYLIELWQYSLSLISLQYHPLVYCSQYHIFSILIHQSIGSLVHSSKQELYLQSQLLFLSMLKQLDSTSLEYNSIDLFWCCLSFSCTLNSSLSSSIFYCMASALSTGNSLPARSWFLTPFFLLPSGIDYNSSMLLLVNLVKLNPLSAQIAIVSFTRTFAFPHYVLIAINHPHKNPS